MIGWRPALRNAGVLTAMIVALADLSATSVLGQSSPLELSSLIAEANLGSPIAQERLGLAYARGERVAPDPAQARFWLTRSATQGNESAQLALSRQLAASQRPENMVSAYKWALVAAKAGSSDAIDQLDQLARSMSSAQITDARAQAAGWSKTSEIKPAVATDTPMGGTEKGALPTPAPTVRREQAAASRPEISRKQKNREAAADRERLRRQIEFGVNVGVAIVSHAMKL